MPRKDYANDRIVVHWDAGRCVHTGIWTRGLPGVFDVTKRPWISVGGAAADEIAAPVAKCPTGGAALRPSRRRTVRGRPRADDGRPDAQRAAVPHRLRAGHDARAAESPAEICQPQEF